jgi:hypothetical protein
LTDALLFEKLRRDAPGSELVTAATATVTAAMATATAVPTAALESAAATAAAEAAAATTRTGGTLLGFTDAQGTALHLSVIETADSSLSFFPVWHLDKPKPTGPACVAIQKNAGRLDNPILTKCRTQFVVLNFVGEISDIYIH